MISASSVDYLMYSGYVGLASHWLQMEETALAKIASGSTEEDPGFYKAKVQTSAFVFEKLLPRTRTHKASMLAPVSVLTDMSNENFSFDHAR